MQLVSRRFHGSTVVITGASRGLGRALAVAFAAEGGFVYAGFHAHGREAEQTARAMADAGGAGATIPLDVRSEPSIEQAIESVLSERGAVDVLVNNAAVVHDQVFALSDLAAWAEVVDINLNGVMRCCRAVVRPMIGRQHGSIVNVASVAAVHASPGLAGYAASKGGVVSFTRTLAAELAPKGVRVNAVVPGFVAAGMGSRLAPQTAERLRAAIPLARFADPSEVVSAVLYLASDQASYVVGQALVVDGGLSL